MMPPVTGIEMGLQYSQVSSFQCLEMPAICCRLQDMVGEKLQNFLNKASLLRPWCFNLKSQII